MRCFFIILPFLSLFLFSCGDRTHFYGLSSSSEVAGSVYGSSSGADVEREPFVLEKTKFVVDFVFQVDTTSSMYHVLGGLGQNIRFLFHEIDDYDWQVAFTSVDHGDHKDPLGIQQNWRDNVSVGRGSFGSLMNLEDGRGILGIKTLTAQTPGYEEVFFHSISHYPNRDCRRPPFCHSHLEQPLRSLQAVMQRASLDNGSFFRPRANFISVTVTNDTERQEDRARATTPKDVERTFKEVFGHLNKQWLHYNILITDERCRRLEEEKGKSVAIGWPLMELAEQTGGESISICDSDYAGVLKNLSEHIEKSLQNSIILRHDPVPDSVFVKFEGQALKWERYGRKIVFKRRKPYRQIRGVVSYQKKESEGLL